MITRAALAALPVTLVATTLASAQDSQCRSLRYRSNFRLNGAMQYINQADAATFPDNKRSNTNNAMRVLNEAAQAGGVDAFSLWYLFGRAYSLNGDLAGTDSAYTKAVAAAPNDAPCVAEISRLRRNIWVPIQQEAVAQLQARNYDSAIALLRKGNLIFREEPGAYLNMANAWIGKNMEDSAVAAWLAASRAGTNPERADLRARGALAAAQYLQRGNKHAEAEAAWRHYIAMKPYDMAARGSLAQSIYLQGRTQEAGLVYDSILSRTDSLDSFGLFDIGVSLFRMAQTDTTNRALWFGKAARAFEAGLAKSPHDRDGLYNASNVYLALADTQKLLQTTTRLVAADSMNRRTLSLHAQAQQMAGQRNETVRTLLRRDSLPFEVAVLQFTPRDSAASIRGGVQNLRNREQAPFNLTIEFLNGRGEVVVSERTEIPTLGGAGTTGSSYDFNLQVTGRGIIAYRYKIG